VRVVGPPTLMPTDVERWGVEVCHDLKTGIAGADVVMMLRLQLERMQGALVPSMREYFRLWGLDREKLEVLAETGIDYMAVVPFTGNLARYSAEAFVELVLRRCFRMRELLIGYDHGFGRQRAGNVNVLRTLGERDGFRVEVVDAVSTSEGQSVSSTSIRRAIAGGDLGRAAESLGRAYSVSGKVIPGAQRGRTIGFPTINLGPPPPRKLLPPEGVYAVRVQTPRGPVGGMMNLGPRPTFGDSTTTLEAHLFDTSGDFYGANVRLDFVARIRETRKFASAEQLSKQLAHDEREARNALTLFAAPNNLKG